MLFATFRSARLSTELAALRESAVVIDARQQQQQQQQNNEAIAAAAALRMQLADNERELAALRVCVRRAMY